MSKIIVEVYVPFLNETYDIFVPGQAQMYVVLGLIKRAVKELSDNRFLPDENTVICYRDSGQILDINYSVQELELQNGSKLMLI